MQHDSLGASWKESFGPLDEGWIFVPEEEEKASGGGIPISDA